MTDNSNRARREEDVVHGTVQGGEFPPVVVGTRPENRSKHATATETRCGTRDSGGRSAPAAG